MARARSLVVSLMLTEMSGHVSFPNGLVRMNLTGYTDWQVPYLRKVPSAIPPSLQMYALRVAGKEGRRKRRLPM
jgi:hypothetical protein